MGLLGSVFGKRKESQKQGKELPWTSLTSAEQLEKIEEKSITKPQLIFKHSTTCGVSRMVLSMFTDSYALGEAVELYILDLHEHREVSHAVESRFGVVHESPQILMVKEGKVSFHASHGAIADIDLGEYV